MFEWLHRKRGVSLHARLDKALDTVTTVASQVASEAQVAKAATLLAITSLSEELGHIQSAADRVGQINAALPPSHSVQKTAPVTTVPVTW